MYRYGCVNRPPGFATVPPEWAAIERSHDPRFPHGVVCYVAALAADKIVGYELVPLPICAPDDRRSDRHERGRLTIGNPNTDGEDFAVVDAGSDGRWARLALYRIDALNRPWLVATVKEGQEELAWYALTAKLLEYRFRERSGR
ncbi:MAG TPA: hypothetical protein VFL91_21315 [Thermomicrobiales bacterium]|nr:hypothetical protein [Thermomicrobiales bacterium]